MIRNKKSIVFIPAVLVTICHATTWFFLGLATKVFLFLIDVFLPPRVKRWLVLSSLYFTLHPTSEERSLAEIDMFNKRTELVDDYMALRIPFLLRHKLWPSKVVKQCIDGVCTVSNDEVRVSKLTESLISHVLPQLRYGRHGDLARDIRTVLHLDTVAG